MDASRSQGELALGGGSHASKRDELREVIKANLFKTTAGMADAILAAGYWKPRTITTEEERASLPDMAVVRSSAGSIANVSQGRAYFFGFEHGVDAKMLALPLDVLWEPEAAEASEEGEAA